MKDEEKTMFSVTMRYANSEDESGVTVERSNEDGFILWPQFVSAFHDALLGMGYVLPKEAETMFLCLMDDNHEWKNEDE